MLRAVWILIAVLASSAPAFADDPTESCRKAPTRACVLEAATAAADKSSKPFVKANLLALIARDQHFYGLAEAPATLARAVEAAKTIPADGDMGPTPPALAAARAEMGDTAGALEFAHGFVNTTSRVYALGGVAMALQRQGKATEAKAAFDLAIEAAEAAPVDKRGFLIVQVATGEARVGAPDAAATFDRAFAAADPKASDGSVGYVVGQRIKAGDYARAYIEISDLDQTWRNILLTSLVTAAANAGDLDTATAAAPSISRTPDAARAMATLAIANFRAGHAMAAAQWIVKAQSVADRETMAALKAEAQADIAGAEAAIGMTMRAKDHFGAVRAVLDAPDAEKFLRGEIARACARGLARSGDLKAALDLLRAQVEAPRMIGDLIAIAADFAAAQQWSAAFEALEAVPWDDQRAAALIEFAAKLPS